jgi:ABC-type transporter Mla subunit MlaD
MNQYLMNYEMDALGHADDLDTLIDAASRPTSPWPGLLNRARQSLQRAINHLNPPITPRSLNNALYQIDGAEALLNDAWREVNRVMTGTQKTRVLEYLSEANFTILEARAQARGESPFVPGARYLTNPITKLHGAIAHIRTAQGFRPT